MSNRIDFKKGLNATRTGFTPIAGEPLYSTDTRQFYIGDGSTPGGVLAGSLDFLPMAGIDATKIISGTIDIARIPVLPSQKTIVSSGGIANLTTEQQNQIGEGTIVTTANGNRWVYNGSGSKVLEASYTVLADISPEWSVIANKPSLVNTFNTRSGTVVPQSGDYNTSQVTENTNLYFTNARAQSAMTGAISTVTTSNLTASRAMVSDASGKVASSAVTSTELSYLDGVTSAIQTQINSKRADTFPVSGTWWQGTPYVTGSGVMDIGRYIDFHETSATTADWDARLQVSSNELCIVSPSYSNDPKVLYHSGNLTKSTIGLGNVDNTSDANKPISSATQTALNGKQATITTGTASQYFKGDLSLGTFQSDVRSTVLTSLSPNNSAIVAADPIIDAFGKTQGQISFLKNTKIGSQNYTNGTDDAVTFPTKVSRGIHFGRSNYGTTPSNYNYMMMLEAYNTKYATIGVNGTGWYVSPLTAIASEPAAYYTIMHSGNIGTNVLATQLSGVTPVNAAIVAGDSIADAFGKTQGQINARSATLYKSGVGVGINGTTESTLRSYTLPANTLSNTDILKITVHGYINLNADGTGTLRIKVGGNTFYTFTKTYGTDSDDCLELILYVAGTRCTLTGSSFNDGLGVATTRIANRIASTTDFTVSNNIVITAQGSVAANGGSLDNLIIEKA